MNEIERTTISRNKVMKSLNPHLLTRLPMNENHEQWTCTPLKLLVPERFDVLAKYLYAKHRDMRAAMGWATDVYREHLAAFGGFRETDYSGKDTFSAFLECFHRVLDSAKRDGFLDEVSLVPIDKNMVIIDGSHRLGACLFY